MQIQSKLMIKFRTLCVLVLFLVLIPPLAVFAQDDPPEGPYYVIQAGDSLWDLAARFSVPVDELMAANHITNADQISAGTKLVFPGLEGVQGQLETQILPFGETLSTLSSRYHISPALLVRLNHITSPASLYAGESVILPVKNEKDLGSPFTLGPGQSLLEMAVVKNENPWSLVDGNSLPGAWSALPGEVLLVPGVKGDGSGAFPEPITGLSLQPKNLSQGKTAVIRLDGPPGLDVKGSLGNQEFRFFQDEKGYIALQGIHALTKPGLYPLRLEVNLPSGSQTEGQRVIFEQSVLIRSGNYPYDPDLQVDPKTIDPAVTQPEDDLWKKLGVPATPQKMWNGLFKLPVPKEFKDCWTSLFGNRRTYNGGAYTGFHSGLDFCGQTGTELYAPAAGRVVYTGSLTVRGNVTVIDHGWGVYTAYDHQSKIDVAVGDQVTPGQLIGLGGATGRTTGPHLHWEVWVGGVQVDPVDWLQTAYP